MTADNPNLTEVPETRDEYVRQFAHLARAGLAGLAAGRPVDFQVSDDIADATIAYRGRLFRYRRRIWPPDFPLKIKVALYVTHLEERLLTARYPDEPRHGPTEL
jgi:hypothetical protein